jgi:adenine-specific DNA methylase
MFKAVDRADLDLYESAAQEWSTIRADDQYVPHESIPSVNRSDPRPISYGYKHYSDLFNFRQLLCLSSIGRTISQLEDSDAKAFIAAAFSDCLAANNMFCYYAFDYQKLTPLFGLHAYHKVFRPVENNVWGTDLGRGSFSKCFAKVIRAKQYACRPYEYRYVGKSRPKQVYTGESVAHAVRPRWSNGQNEPFAVVLNQSSVSLSAIRPRSVDLILSDPPYYDNLAYSELSDFYHVWLRRLALTTYPAHRTAHTPMSTALYAAPSDASAQHFAKGLKQIFAECARVLKSSGLFVFTFHHRDPRAWTALGGALASAKFVVTNVFPVRSEGESRFHSSEGNLKWDAVFCCRKVSVVSLLYRPTPRGDAEIKRHADMLLQRWRLRLRSAGLRIGKADQQSLLFAFALRILLGHKRSVAVRELISAIRHIDETQRLV